MKKIFFLFSISLVTIVSCGKKSPAQEKSDLTDTSSSVKADSMSTGFEVDTFHLVKTETGCPKNECTTVDIYYEKIRTSGQPVYDSINVYIDEFMKMALTNLGYEKGEIDLNKLASDFITSSNDPELDLGGTWDWQHSTHIFQPVNEVISVSSGFGGYTGGAHGNYTSVTTNFFVSTGKEVKMVDLFKDVAAVNKIGLSYFKKDNELDEGIDLVDHGLDVSDENFELNENFDISTESITWQYNQYEIGPYSAGMLSVTIPMKILEPHLKVKFTEITGK